MERAERFGIVTEELVEKRIKQRQERFGIETKDSANAKKQERMKRFAVMEKETNKDQAEGGLTADELETKRKARMDRFGA